MDSSSKKRVRSSNWDEDEKLITEKNHVIENKDTSTNKNNLKKAAWQEILSCKQRDLIQMQTQWRNTKGKVKGRESEYRCFRMMTGGGPPPPSPSAQDFAIIQALPNEFIIDNNKFDSNGLHMDTIKEVPREPVRAKAKAGNIVETPVSINKPLKRFRQIKMHTHSKNNSEDFERELFLFAKKSKEREFE